MIVLNGMNVESFINDMIVVSEHDVACGRMIFGKHSKHGDSLVHFSPSYEFGVEIFAEFD